MQTLRTLFRSPIREFADSLANAEPRPRQLASARILVFALLGLCFVPRAVLACMLEAVCSDGHFYIAVADALDRGDINAAFSYLNMNVYPAVLLLLHRTGLDWIVAAKLCGVLLGSLTVMPLFGWVRRMFDDRIAVVACVLYAIHPEIIELSPEPIRETMFWFFVTLFLYAAIRAVSEHKLWLFALAGVALTFAAYTRIEGWLLLLPVVVWSACRFQSRSESRARLIAGVLVCLAMMPALLLLTNVTLLRHHTRWEWGRLAGVAGANNSQVVEADAIESPKPSSSLRASGEPVPAASVVVPIVERTVEDAPKPKWQMFIAALVSSYEPLALLLTVTGLFAARGALLHRDKLVLWIIAPFVLLVVWIRLTIVGDLNGRYFLLTFFLLAPFTAIGLVGGLRRLEMVLSRLKSFGPRRTWTASAMALIVVVSLGDALLSRHTSRHREASLGRWLQRELGPLESVVADKDSSTVGYFAKGTNPRTLLNYEPVEDIVFQLRPDMLILHAPMFASWPREYQEVVARSCAASGLHQIHVDDSHAGHEEFLIFASRRSSSLAAKLGPAHR